MDFRNLLGRDLLAGFDYKIDNSKKIFEICMAERFNRISDFLPGQEIHFIGGSQ